MTHKPALILALVVGAIVALAPVLAEARAGGGSSMGSRGGRTYYGAPATPTAPQSRPVERSVTQPAQPQRPTAPAQPQPGFFSGHPFLSGLMGGLIGAGIGGLLFGHGFFGYGLGFAGMLGLLLQLTVVAGLVALAMAYFRRRPADGERRSYAYATAEDPASQGPFHAHRPIPDVAPIDVASGRVGAAPAAAALRDEVGITDADYGEFEKLLVAIQKAWSEADIGTLRRHLTPEMLSYFSEELSSNASSGIANRVEDVQFETGDLAEAWTEGDLQYATVAMKWTARDYTVRADTGILVEGSKTERSEATEVWTFVRAPGGRWLLSAIQQV